MNTYTGTGKVGFHFAMPGDVRPQRARLLSRFLFSSVVPLQTVVLNVCLG